MVDGTIRSTDALNATRLALKNCPSFTKFNLEINDEHVDTEKVTKKIKKKHNKIIALAKNKLNTIDTLLSSALNDSKISHEEFRNIITEENIFENIKENIKELATESSEEEKSATL